MRRTPDDPGPAARRLRREVLALVVLVLAVHVLFITGYYVAGIGRRAETVRAAYAGVWTVVTLAAVLRGLLRVRAARGRRR